MRCPAAPGWLAVYPPRGVVGRASSRVEAALSPPVADLRSDAQALGDELQAQREQACTGFLLQASHYRLVTYIAEKSVCRPVSSGAYNVNVHNLSILVCVDQCAQ